MRRTIAFIIALIVFIVVFVTVLGNDDADEKCSPQSGDGTSSADGGVPDGAYSLPEKNALDHITSGWRTPERPSHAGLDIAQGHGTPLYAYADGVVAKAGFATGFGDWVVIDHQIDGKLYSTVYGHVFEEDIHVKVGDKVKAGQHIADEGYNGEVSPPGPQGSHLHFEVWEGGRDAGHDIDPMPWLKKAVEPGSAGKSTSTDGADVFLVGDSLSVGAKAQLEKALPGADIDAKGGRQYSEGLKILQQKKPKAKTVVMALGTNGPFSQKDIDDTLEAAGDARVVLTTVAGPKVSAASSVNPLVEANADKVTVADWATLVAQHPDYVGGDGIHHSEAGKAAFASMLADAVGKKSSGKKSPRRKGPGMTSGGGEVPDSPVIQSEEHLQVDTIRLARSVAQRFPQIQTIGGWRPEDPYPDHPSGRAADIMIPNWDTEEGKQLGDDILEYLYGNRDYFQVEYFIWRQKYIPAEGEGNIMEDRGSPTQNHYDHIHVTTIGHGFPKEGQKYGEAPEGGSEVPGSPSGVAGEDCDPIAGVDVGLNDGEIPEEYRKWIRLAGQLCEEAPAPLIAGLIYQESQFSTTAVSIKGANGPGQFMPETWKGVGAKVDENGEVAGPPGSGSPNHIPDAVMASGRYLCSSAKQVKEWKANGTVSGDDTELMLAAYNAGGGAVQRFGGIPPYLETQEYVKIIPEHAKRFEEKAN